MGRLQKGINDLKTWCEENGEWGQQLIQEWVGLDEFGNKISMEDITCKNARKVQWRCSNSHRWIARISNRTYLKQGCPYCLGQRVSIKNSLKTWCQNNSKYGQQLLQEWTGLDENNNSIDIAEVSYASTKKVQWRCSKGHKWLATIANRTFGRGCPYCFSTNIVREDNRLDKWCQNNKEFGKQLIQEWVGLDENDNPIDINKIAKASGKKVQWKCKDGHTWTARISDRTTKNLVVHIAQVKDYRTKIG